MIEDGGGVSKINRGNDQLVFIDWTSFQMHMRGLIARGKGTLISLQSVFVFDSIFSARARVKTIVIILLLPSSDRFPLEAKGRRITMTTQQFNRNRVTKKKMKNTSKTSWDNSPLSNFLLHSLAIDWSRQQFFSFSSLSTGWHNYLQRFLFFLLKFFSTNKYSMIIWTLKVHMFTNGTIIFS